MKKVFLLLMIGLMAGSAAMAQTLKLGHINSAALLESMPEVKKADEELKVYAKQFQETLETMGKDYQKKLQELQSQQNTLSEAMKEVKIKELTDLQARIESTQQNAEQKVGQKKETLYTPLLEKADKAIKDVAKEKAYDYVFDVSSGALLYAKDSDDLMPLVKAKLGIK